MTPDMFAYAVERKMASEVKQRMGREVQNSPLLRSQINLYRNNGLNSSLRNPEELRRELRPEKLAKDISARMYESGLSPDTWARADVETRKNMICIAANIMAQEMILPQEVRQMLSIQFDSLNGANGMTNLFIRHDATTGALHIEQPVVTMDESSLTKRSCADVYGTLFHEMIHVLQEVSLTDAQPWTENISEWRADYEGRVSGLTKKGDFVDYLTGPMEAYAHAQDALFKKVYSAWEIRRDFQGMGFQEVGERGTSTKMGQLRGSTISFTGGLSASQGLKIAADGNMSQARSLRTMARQTESPSEAKILSSRATSLEQGARRLYRQYAKSLERNAREKAEKAKR